MGIGDDSSLSSCASSVIGEGISEKHYSSLKCSKKKHSILVDNLCVFAMLLVLIGMLMSLIIIVHYGFISGFIFFTCLCFSVFRDICLH